MYRPIRNAGLKLEQLDDMAVIIDSQARQLHHINSTAMVVWMLCDGFHSVDDIVAEIGAGVRDQSIMKRDVLLLLAQMNHNGLLHDFNALEDSAFDSDVGVRVRMTTVRDESPGILGVSRLD